MAAAYPADVHLWTQDPELLHAPGATAGDHEVPPVPPIPPVPPPEEQDPHAPRPAPSPPTPPSYSPEQVYDPTYAEHYVYSHDPQTSHFLPRPEDQNPPPTDEATTAAAVAAAQAANIAAELQNLSTGDPWPLLHGEDEALAALLKRRHARARNSPVLQSHTVAVMDTIRTSGWLFLMARGEPENLRFIESALWVESLFTRHPDLVVCMAPLPGSEQAAGPEGDASQLALQSASYALAIAAAATGQPGAPVKRGPGRPKRPIPPPDPNPPPKRKRGRPRKIRPPPEPKIPKKRGRPPKNRPKEPEASKPQDPLAESAASLSTLAAASESAQREVSAHPAEQGNDHPHAEPETQAEREARDSATAIAAAFSSVLQDQIQSDQEHKQKPDDLSSFSRDGYNLTDDGPGKVPAPTGPEGQAGEDSARQATAEEGREG